MKPKYFLRGKWENEWKEVSKEQFIRAERDAGFRSKFGEDAVATAGFGGHGVEGKVEYVEEDKEE